LPGFCLSNICIPPYSNALSDLVRAARGYDLAVPSDGQWYSDRESLRLLALFTHQERKQLLRFDPFEHRQIQASPQSKDGADDGGRSQNGGSPYELQMTLSDRYRVATECPLFGGKRHN
jgi:hypothetical protein